MEPERALVELACRYPEQAVEVLLYQLVSLLGGTTPNSCIQGLVRRQLCRRTVAELLSRGLSSSCRGGFHAG